MAICDWPSSERPREKLIEKGPQALSDAELLAIFLRTGYRGKSAVDLARELLVHFNGLRPLLEASKEDFCRCQGLGDAKYTQLQSVMEMSRRHLSESLRYGSSLNSPREVRQFLTSHLRHRMREVFAVLFLDSQHRLITYEELFFGTIDSANIHPREILRQALAHNASAVILAHNHPSGIAEPSQSDRHVTDILTKALGLVDIRVIDHLVIGDGHIVSFAERGWINQ